MKTMLRWGPLPWSTMAAVVTAATCVANPASAQGSSEALEVAPLVDCAPPDALVMPDPECMAEEAFWSAQWAMQSTAAQALDNVNARFAQGSGPLADLARNLDEAREELQSVESEYFAALALPDDGLREQLLAAVIPRLSAVKTRITTTEDQLYRQFPDYGRLVAPRPLSVAETQALLAPGDALVMLLPGDTGTFVFFVSRTELEWERSDLDSAELARIVDELRLSMGVDGARVVSGFAPEFDRQLAFELYTGLFGSLAGKIVEAEHIYTVAAGPLSAFPLGALVTEVPNGEDSDPEAMRSTKWLLRSVAMTVLPAPASLRALDQRLTSAAKRPFLGIGNACTGWGVRNAPEPPPELCGEKTGADEIEAQRRVEAADTGRGFGFSEVTRAGNLSFLSADELRFSISYLPGTRSELLALSSIFGADPDHDLIMARDATESRLRSGQLELSERRVIVFATHGLVATDGIENLDEPGLVLTPPTQASVLDDGFLSASEIAADLRLDADFVILSACNTASPAKSGADSLSGLATAFFYAGARSILVSHWPVQDEIAPLITTGTIEAYDRFPESGKARALQAAIAPLMDNPDTADPYFWAPFVLVGQN